MAVKGGGEGSYVFNLCMFLSYLTTLFFNVGIVVLFVFYSIRTRVLRIRFEIVKGTKLPCKNKTVDGSVVL